MAEARTFLQIYSDISSVAKLLAKKVNGEPLLTVNDIDITIENNNLKINFITDGEVNLKEINEYYFTKKIFKGVESFSNKLDLKYIMLIDNKKWKI